MQICNMIGFLKFQHGSSKLAFLAGNEGETNLKSQLTDDYYTFLVNMSQMSPNDILLQLAFLAWISRQDCAEEDKLQLSNIKFSFKHPIFIATFIKQCNRFKLLSNFWVDDLPGATAHRIAQEFPNLG